MKTFTLYDDLENQPFLLNLIFIIMPYSEL